ncbi:hypothetical protein WJX81_002435 [Elliptochloris bilobata]|uniref:Uncharacterized protein n=1 Tax=Elliptochloris bilobata TaxID=381761 RepID=A0AAW1RYD3_9CHLO
MCALMQGFLVAQYFELEAGTAARRLQGQNIEGTFPGIAGSYYIVTLFFQEPWFSNKYTRVFNILIDGALKVAAKATKMVIDFTPVLDQPVVSALSIQTALFGCPASADAAAAAEDYPCAHTAAHNRADKHPGADHFPTSNRDASANHYASAWLTTTGLFVSTQHIMVHGLDAEAHGRAGAGAKGPVPAR